MFKYGVFCGGNKGFGKEMAQTVFQMWWVFNLTHMAVLSESYLQSLRLNKEREREREWILLLKVDIKMPR